MPVPNFLKNPVIVIAGTLLLLGGAWFFLSQRFLVDKLSSEAQTAGQVIFTSGFETGKIQCGSCNPDGWGVRNDSGVSNAESVGTSYPLRAGNYSLRIRANKSDPWRDAPRVELEGHNQSFFEKNVEYWVGWSIYLPADGSYEFDSQQNEILTQFRHRDDSCDASSLSPPNALRPQGGRWRWDVRWDADACMSSTTPDGQVIVDMGPQERGRWTDFVARFVFSHDSRGVLQVWRDGTMVVDRVGQPNYYNNPSGPYMKIGFYKAHWLDQASNVTTRALYYDAVKVYRGTGGYAYVAPGGTPPSSGNPADLNADGRVDVIDLGILLSAWGQTTKPKSDINQDGRVDVVDLGILLSRWGG